MNVLGQVWISTMLKKNFRGIRLIPGTSKAEWSFVFLVRRHYVSPITK